MTSHDVRISASLLAADFANLGRDVQAIEAAGCDEVHFDVMDGQFVPNISFGPMALAAIRPLTSLPVDVHMMVREPGRFIRDFADAGADMLTVHAEACAHLFATLQEIRQAGMRAGVALNPATPAAMAAEVLSIVDRALVMTVNPGYGGQAFIGRMAGKISTLAAMTQDYAPSVELAVDGGVKAETAPVCVSAGASVLISGTGIFNHAGGVPGGLSALRGAASG